MDLILGWKPIPLAPDPGKPPIKACPKIADFCRCQATRLQRNGLLYLLFDCLSQHNHYTWMQDCEDEDSFGGTPWR